MQKGVALSKDGGGDKKKRWTNRQELGDMWDTQLARNGETVSNEGCLPSLDLLTKLFVETVFLLKYICVVTLRRVAKRIVYDVGRVTRKAQLR